MRYPIVVKADGLALGKGVIIAHSPWSAAMAIHEIMERAQFGDAGRTIVVEEFLKAKSARFTRSSMARRICFSPGRRITNAPMTTIGDRTPAAWAHSVRRIEF